jgi:hypothetical protein
MFGYATLVVMGVASVVGILVSNYFIQKVMMVNRQSWSGFEKTGRLKPEIIHWLIAHIRDDIGSLLQVLILTNGLLAAIVAALALNAFR